MISFDLVVRSPSGSLSTQRIRASDTQAAVAQAGAQGLSVLSCEPLGGADAKVQLTKRAAPLPDVGTFAHELASLLSAGLSVLQALRTLAATGASSGRPSALVDVARLVSEGQTLSTALARHEGRFPALLIATVRASEQTGTLSEALLRYAEHQQNIKALRDKVTGAAVYPLLLLAVGALVVLFLLSVVVPRFATLVASTRQELPWSSRLLMSWGDLVSAHPGFVAAAAVGVAVALALGVRHLWRNGARSRWVESLPVLGAMLRDFRHAQLYRTTGMLVHGGIPLPTALALCASLLGDEDRQRLAQTIAQIREGRSLSDALDSSGIADPVSRGMLAVAEQSGALSEILMRIAQFKESRLQRSVDWAGKLIEPALMIIIGLVIGGIVVMMYLPIFDLASSLQ